MKKHILIVLSLFLIVGTADISAQNFLKKLEKTVKKEVENRVQKEVKKSVNKGMDKGIESVKGDQPQTQTQSKQTASKSSQSNASQSQSQSDDIFEVAQSRVAVTELATMVEYGPTEGKLNGHTWVDLGLPSGTRWATCNIDATAPEQPGKLYAWGETATKTNFVRENSKTDKKPMEDISGNPTYDVATAKWGKGWRIPTEEQFKELLKYCSYTYEPCGNIYWQKFTSSINKKVIYLPATGYKEGSAKLTYPKTNGYYWTSTPSTDQYNTGAGVYAFAVDEGRMGHGGRSTGGAVRPVADYDVDTEIPADGETNGHKWVDLGLPSGLKWATYNLGADAVDQDGGHYRWGAITTYYKGEKYAKDDVQKDICGDARYDAATAHWGSDWYMPTVRDFAELMENCTWEWTQIGRRKGLKVTSKHNGKYIFLPASGEMNYNCDWDKLPQDINKKLYYWTSSHMPGWQNKYDAYLVTAYKDAAYFTSKIRYNTGFSIRPVTK